MNQFFKNTFLTVEKVFFNKKLNKVQKKRMNIKRPTVVFLNRFFCQFR